MCAGGGRRFARVSERRPQPDFGLAAGLVVRLGAVGHESEAVVERPGPRVGGEDPQRDFAPAVLADLIKCRGEQSSTDSGAPR